MRIPICCHLLFFSVLLSPAVSSGQKPTYTYGFPTFGNAIKEGDLLEFMMIRSTELLDESLLDTTNVKLLGNQEVLRQMEFSEAQLNKIESIYTTIENEIKANFGPYRRDDLADPEFKAKRSKFVESQQKFFVREFENSLMPHQKQLLKVFRVREDVKRSTFVDVILSEAVSERLELTSDQRKKIKKENEVLWERRQQKLAKASSDFHEKVFDVLSPESAKNVRSALGEEFFDGSYRKNFRAHNSAEYEKKFGLATIKLVENDGALKAEVVPISAKRWHYTASPLILLSLSEVASDLEFNDSQKKQIETYYKEWQTAVDKKLPRIESEYTKTELDEMQSVQLQVQEESKQKLQDVMLKFQSVRLNQIHNRKAVAMMSFKKFLLEPIFEKQLGLSSSELNSIRKINFSTLSDSRGEKRILADETKEIVFEYRNKLVDSCLEKRQLQLVYKVFGSEFFGK